MTKSVAVIGAGMMGLPMAERIHGAGFDLTVCDVNDATLSKFGAKGVKTTRSPAECAGADVILVVVATADQTREVILGETGVLSALSQDHSPILVVMGTISREAVVALSDEVASHGKIRVLDAPISGGPLRAEDGTLAIMVGGDAADLEVARPVLNCLGKKIFHCGPVGAGQAVKIINNLIGSINVIVVGEAYRIALENGLPLEDLAPVLEASSGRVNLSVDASEAYASFARWGGADADFEGVRRVMRKDMKLALDMASVTTGSYPATRQMVELIDALDKDTQDNWRFVGEHRENSNGSD